MKAAVALGYVLVIAGAIYGALTFIAERSDVQPPPNARALSSADSDSDLDVLSCKMNELAVRNNMIIKAVTDAATVADSTLEAASSLPVISLDKYYNLFCVGGESLKLVKSLSIVVPNDWECQSRKVAEPWACPNGTPSKCRYFEAKRTELRRATGPFGGGHFDAALAAELKDVDDICVRYYCYGLGGQFEADSAYNKVGAKESCCGHFKTLEEHDIADSVLAVLGEEKGTKLGAFTDPDTEGWNPKVAEVCGDASTVGLEVTHTAFLKKYHWGYSDWREDPSVDEHMIHFEINRFEMGPDFGIQLYSPQLDTVRVFTDGQAQFNPTSASVDIDLFDNMTYEPILDFECGEVLGGGARRLQLASFPNGELDKSTERAKPSMDELAKKRFSGACHPKDGCQEHAAALNGRKERKRRLGRRGGGMSSGASTFALGGGSNRAGND